MLTDHLEVIVLVFGVTFKWCLMNLKEHATMSSTKHFLAFNQLIAWNSKQCVCMLYLCMSWCNEQWNHICHCVLVPHHPTPIGRFQKCGVNMEASKPFWTFVSKTAIHQQSHMCRTYLLCYTLDITGSQNIFWMLSTWLRLHAIWSFCPCLYGISTSATWVVSPHSNIYWDCISQCLLFLKLSIQNSFIRIPINVQTKARKALEELWSTAGQSMQLASMVLQITTIIESHARWRVAQRCHFSPLSAFLKSGRETCRMTAAINFNVTITHTTSPCVLILGTQHQIWPQSLLHLKVTLFETCQWQWQWSTKFCSSSPGWWPQHWEQAQVQFWAQFSSGWSFTPRCAELLSVHPSPVLLADMSTQLLGCGNHR